MSFRTQKVEMLPLLNWSAAMPTAMATMVELENIILGQNFQLKPSIPLFSISGSLKRSKSGCRTFTTAIDEGLLWW